MNYLLSDRTNLCFKVVSGCLALFFFFFCSEYVKPGVVDALSASLFR